LVKALTTLKKSLNENKVSIEQIMQFWLILNAKYDLGLFQDPYKYCDVKELKMKFYNRKQIRSKKNCITIFSIT
jgi:beta-glucosidase